MKAIALLALLISAVAAQSVYQVRIAGYLNTTSSDVQISFAGTANGDPNVPIQSSLRFSSVNVVLKGLDSSVFHYHAGSTDPKYAVKQNYGLSFVPSSVTFDSSNNLVLSGRAQASYQLLSAMFPPPACPRGSQCDTSSAAYTSVDFTLTLASPTAGGVLGDLQLLTRAANTRVLTTFPQWTYGFTARSSLSRSEVAMNFISYTLNPVQGSQTVNKVIVNGAFVDVFIPRYSFWRNLALQPVGINVPIKHCLNYPCPCCSVYFTADSSATGPAGMAAGRPQADLQWRKSGITFTWQPMVNLTDNSLKVEDTDARITQLVGSYNDPAAIEIFFVLRVTHPAYTPISNIVVEMGTAGSSVIASEYDINSCTQITRLAHSLGHVMGLFDAETTPVDPATSSSSNTLMCPMNELCGNPTRNSYENQLHTNNPLFTHYLSIFGQPADDCQYSADCGSCPHPVYTIG